MKNKYKNVVCSKCGSKGTTKAKGRAFGNHGKKAFECTACGNT
jgi:hypothetical protein